MRLAIGIVILGVSWMVLSQSQNTQTAPDTTTKPATKKSVVNPPKAIETPNPVPTLDHGTSTTVFTVTVGTDGLVHDPKMIKSSGSNQADANAMEAVKKWKFKPATKDGVPVPVRINIEINSKVM